MQTWDKDGEVHDTSYRKPDDVPPPTGLEAVDGAAQEKELPDVPNFVGLRADLDEARRFLELVLDGPDIAESRQSVVHARAFVASAQAQVARILPAIQWDGAELLERARRAELQRNNLQNRNDSLRREFGELEDELEEARRALEELDELRKANEVIRKRYAEATEELEKGLAENAELLNERNEARSALKELRESHELTVTTLAAAQAHNAELQKKFSELEDELEEYAADRIAATRAEVERERDTLLEALRESTAARGALRDERDALRKALDGRGPVGSPEQIDGLEWILANSDLTRTARDIVDSVITVLRGPGAPQDAPAHVDEPDELQPLEPAPTRAFPAFVENVRKGIEDSDPDELEGALVHAALELGDRAGWGWGMRHAINVLAETVDVRTTAHADLIERVEESARRLGECLGALAREVNTHRTPGQARLELEALSVVNFLRLSAGWSVEDVETAARDDYDGVPSELEGES